MTGERYWVGEAPETDDFGGPIVKEFVDGRTRLGSWAVMNPANFARYGSSAGLGTGRGQRYKRQDDGRWLKVEG
jgi:hypothetical protein